MGFRSFVSALILARPVASWTVNRGVRAFHRGPRVQFAVGQISVADLKARICHPMLAHERVKRNIRVLIALYIPSSVGTPIMILATPYHCRISNTTHRVLSMEHYLPV